MQTRGARRGPFSHLWFLFGNRYLLWTVVNWKINKFDVFIILDSSRNAKFCSTTYKITVWKRQPTQDFIKSTLLCEAAERSAYASSTFFMYWWPTANDKINVFLLTHVRTQFAIILHSNGNIVFELANMPFGMQNICTHYVLELNVFCRTLKIQRE